jgi:hypothetical protein
MHDVEMVAINLVILSANRWTALCAGVAGTQVGDHDD